MRFLINSLGVVQEGVQGIQVLRGINLWQFQLSALVDFLFALFDNGVWMLVDQSGHRCCSSSCATSEFSTRASVTLEPRHN